MFEWRRDQVEKYIFIQRFVKQIRESLHLCYNHIIHDVVDMK